MKALEILKPKEKETSQALQKRLLELLRKVWPLIEVSDLGEPETDVLYRLKSKGRTWSLVAQVLTSAQPRDVRRAIKSLQDGLKWGQRHVYFYGVILAPFLSEESARICAAAGVGYVDLAGNAHLTFGSVYVDVRSPERPKFEKRELQSLFSPKACRILHRLLLGPLTSWTVLGLHVATQTSLGLVSGVKKQLLEREWITETPKGMEVTKPNAILDAWAKADNWNKRTIVREYSTLVYNPMDLAGKLNESLASQSPMFTQWFAASLRHPHTISPIVTAYVSEFPDDSVMKEKLLGRRVEKGGTLRLVQPKDPGIFLIPHFQAKGGFYLVSDVQIYLDLLQSGLRGEEQAAELRRWPDFSGAGYDGEIRNLW